MKFFTLDWWRGVQSLHDYDPVPDFRSHLATIRAQLPSDLLALQETFSLHDSNVREITYDSESNKLNMWLDGSDGKGGLRRFHLTYNDVHSFRSTADPEIGLSGPHGYGDLGYDEADVTEDGRLEHRLLFSSGIEFQIIFGGFDLEWKDAT